MLNYNLTEVLSQQIKIVIFFWTNFGDFSPHL